MQKPLKFIFKLAFLSILLLTTTCKKDELVKVTKLEIGSESNVTATTATVAATFVDLSGNVTAFGHCYATSSNPGVSGSKTTNSGAAQEGVFSSNLSGLSANTTYYVRAYAQEGDKAIYSSGEISFTTLEAKYITITAPVATDIWEKGSTQTIKWDDNIDENVTISLLKAGIVDREIIANTESDGNYNWTLPTAADLTVDTDYSIKIASISNSSIIDQSTNFTISALLPTVTTDAITDITYESASSGGNVTDDGGDPVTAKGVCWSTSQNPTTADDKTSDGTGTGTFTSSLTGLADNTTYHVMAYATNSVETGYGEDIEFTTSLAPYIIVTSPTDEDIWEMASSKQITWEHNITAEQVKIELYKGGSWREDIEAEATNTEYIGSYSWNIPDDLTDASDYQIRISDGSIEALSDNFEIFGKIEDYEKHTYRIVKIGNQWWMRENLRSTKYSSGNSILRITDGTTWQSLTKDAKVYCYYNNDSSENSVPYGVLYTWAAAMNSSVAPGTQGVCPTGWHLPSDEEWKQLEMQLGMNTTEADNTGWRGTDEGGKLKETGTAHWNSPNEGATNESDFTALPGGYRSSNTGNFGTLNTHTYYWTSTSQGDYNAWYRDLSTNEAKVARSDRTRTFGYSVRCVKN